MPFCSSCGSQHPDSGDFCPNCGARVSPIDAQSHSYQQASYTPPVQRGMVSEIFSKSLTFIFKKPILLLGLSILNSLLVYLAIVLSFIPIIWLPIVFVFEYGMTAVYLNGYRGNEISAKQLFAGFTGNFFRNAGGMGWMKLWVFIWGLIPLAGPILAIIKSYSYRFVPYILQSEPETSGLEALKKSMAQTEGYKGKMFLADLLVFLGVAVIFIVLALLAMIPYAGILFKIILFIVYALIMIFMPFLLGIIKAAFYDEISSLNSQD